MIHLYKFPCLSSMHRCLLVRTILLLVAVRLGLWLLPFHALQRLLAWIAQRPLEPRKVAQTSIDNVIWAVVMASRYVPRATCLTQALAARVLLVRRGYPTCLRIGVARSETGQFQAHAWVEYAGSVVIGGADAPMRFTPLPPLERESG
jgi:hypothetical protein